MLLLGDESKLSISIVQITLQPLSLVRFKNGPRDPETDPQNARSVENWQR